MNTRKSIKRGIKKRFIAHYTSHYYEELFKEFQRRFRKGTAFFLFSVLEYLFIILYNQCVLKKKELNMKRFKNVGGGALL